MLLKAINIHKNYQKLSVLKGINLEIQAGEITAIIGTSGAGKSTLLHILGTLDRADIGTILFKDTDLQKLSSTDLAIFRNKHIGFVFQFHNLMPEFTAFENICLPAFLQTGNTKTNRNTIEKRANELLALLDMSSRKDHKPSELSGGEQQRISVARALMNQPDIIFADEPSGNLDTKHANELHELFFHLRKEFKQTFVIVTHNLQLAAMADRTIELEKGEIKDAKIVQTQLL
jgi:lipoprotein-releasing system ATP-binding protein